MFSVAISQDEVVFCREHLFNNEQTTWLTSNLLEHSQKKRARKVDVEWFACLVEQPGQSDPVAGGTIS